MVNAQLSFFSCPPLSCLSALKPGPHLPLLLLHLQISKPFRADPPTPPSSPAFLSQRHSQIRITPPLPTFSSLCLPPSASPPSLYLCACVVSLAGSSSASDWLPGHLSCRGKRASCQRLKTERRRRKKQQQQQRQEQVPRRSPGTAGEEEKKVQEEEEGDPRKGGTFGIEFEMCSPLICSGQWRVVRGFALVCVCVHVCLRRCVRVRVCATANSAGCDLYCSRNH